MNGQQLINEARRARRKQNMNIYTKGFLQGLGYGVLIVIGILAVMAITLSAWNTMITYGVIQ